MWTVILVLYYFGSLLQAERLLLASSVSLVCGGLR